MSKMKEHPVEVQSNPALDEFVESVARVNDGLSDVISCALRMQMLIMEDAANMMAEFGSVDAVAKKRAMRKGDQ
jgi:hypothetical protein